MPEVYCITKAAIKNVHFCTELSKVAALVANSTCLFSCCNSSSVETTPGNSVTKMIIESLWRTRRGGRPSPGLKNSGQTLFSGQAHVAQKI